MKSITLIFILFLSISNLFAQNQEWSNYELDSVISVDLPGDVYELDTLMRDIELYQIFSNAGNSSFVAQKTRFEKDNQNESTSKLPHDAESLNKQYQDVIRGIEGEIGYTLAAKKPIKKVGFEGYQLFFEDNNGNPTGEVQFYLLNKHLYTFFYINEVDFDKEAKQAFYNSIQINTDGNISQFLGKSQTFRRTKWITKAILNLLLFGGIIFIVSRIFRKKS